MLYLVGEALTSRQDRLGLHVYYKLRECKTLALCLKGLLRSQMSLYLASDPRSKALKVDCEALQPKQKGLKAPVLALGCLLRVRPHTSGNDALLLLAAALRQLQPATNFEGFVHVRVHAGHAIMPTLVCDQEQREQHEPNDCDCEQHSGTPCCDVCIMR